MSIIAQKLGVRLTRKNGMLIMRLLQKDSKAENFQFNSNACQEIKYAEVKKLPLPLNFRNFPDSERMAFSKGWGRDILGMYLAAFSSPSCVREDGGNGDKHDPRIEKFTCSGPVNLSSSMQTNVPQPFRAKVRPTHLNMPHGQWRQEAKYISEELIYAHYSNMQYLTPLVQSKRSFSTEKKVSESDEIVKSSDQDKKLTKLQMLKAAIKEYGITIVVLHIALSLVFLGIFYILVKNGVKLEDFIKEYGLSDGAGVVASASPFILAYAIQKATAPIRIGITLTLTPFVVRFLRKSGFKVKGR